MNRFKAYRLFDEGGTVHARFVDMGIDELDPGEVLVRNRWASVNYKDALAASGRGRIIRRFPCTGGIDAAGVVEASSDPRFAPGDEVIVHGRGLGVSHDGGYAAYVRAPGDWPVKLPPGVSLRDAITLGVAGYTAALAVDLMQRFGLEPGQGPVLVNGATGGVGSVAIDLLAGLGHEVVAVTGKAAEADYLKSLGAAAVLSHDEVRAGGKPLEPQRWAGAVDSLGGEPLAALTRTMKTDGVIASIGNAAGIELHTTVMPFILRGVRLVGVNSDNPPAVMQRVWQRLGTDLKPRRLGAIARPIGFDELPAAVEAVIAGQVRGRTIVAID